MPKSEFTCCVCAKTFLNYPSQMGKSHHCSKACYAQSLKSKAPPNKGKKTVFDKPCALCGASISGMRSEVARQKFCSKKCADNSMRTPVESLHDRYQVSEETGCWNWLGYLRGGYGRVKIGGKNISAHRAIYEEKVGPIPAGMELDHLCRNRACVNPAHLEPVTHKENIQRGQAGYYKQSEETQAKRSASLKAYYEVPENRIRRSEILRRAWHTRRAKNGLDSGGGGGRS